MRNRLLFALLAAAFACSLSAAPAHAQRSRVFVASYGNDSNPCTFGSPCKTFQQAVNVVLAGGEVTAIDSAGFGPINITKSVTITSPDGVEAGIVPNPPTADAIVINAGAPDAIVLRGLTLNGSGVGANGIVFNTGASLTVTNCVVQNFAGTSPNGNGILIQPTSGILFFTITNTTVLNNALDGISYLPPSGTPTAYGVIDHVVTNGNAYGVVIDTSSLGAGTTVVTVSNSVASENSNQGIHVDNASNTTMKVSIDNVSASTNTVGIEASHTSNVLLGRSVITGSFDWGISNNTSPNTFYSYGDNRINLNAIDINGSAPNTTFKTQ